MAAAFPTATKHRFRQNVNSEYLFHLKNLLFSTGIDPKFHAAVTEPRHMLYAKRRSERVKWAMGIRPFATHEIPVLIGIEHSARQRYAHIHGLEFVTCAPGIKPERFRDGETWVAELDDVIYGYVLLQPMDGYLYIANIMVKDGASELGIGAWVVSQQ